MVYPRFFKLDLQRCSSSQSQLLWNFRSGFWPHFFISSLLLKTPIWVLRFVLLYTDDLPDNVLCNITMYADNTTLYSRCDWAFDLWQYLQLNSHFKYDLGDTAEWVRKRLVDINARKTLLVSLDHFRNCCAISVKMDRPVFNEKSFIKLLVLSFSSKSN